MDLNGFFKTWMRIKMNEWFGSDLQIWMNRYIRGWFMVQTKLSLCLTN
jgi:hypothetical protein